MPERCPRNTLPMSLLPSSLILEVTSRCNYKCPFCYCVWHEFPALARPALSTAAWKDIISECTMRGVKSLLFTGGEALLRRDIFDLLAHARKVLPDGRIEIFTNGSRMTEDLLYWLKRRKIRIATSLQGLNTYGELTGTRRSYRRLLSLIARAAELQWPVAVSITVNQINLGEAADLFAAAALSRPETILVGAVMAEGRVRRNLDLMLAPEEWEDVKQTIRHLPDCGVPYSFCDEFFCHCRDFPVKWIKRFGEDAKRCPAGRDFGVIGPNGRFRKCLHTVEAFEWRREGKGTK